MAWSDKQVDSLISENGGLQPRSRYPGNWKELRRKRLEAAALEMRERNLTRGTGCKSTARAIEQRTGVPLGI